MLKLRMQSKDYSTVPVVWKPSDESGRSTKNFCRYVSEKYHVQIDNFKDLHKWSVENILMFWEELWTNCGVLFSRPYESVYEKKACIAAGFEWFPGARMNYAENVLRNRNDDIAIIAIGEEREVAKWTFSELYKETCRYAASLRKLGLKKNDNVVCVMSNREEAVFAMLATVSIGAIWSGALPLYGAYAILARFKQTMPTFLFTIDQFLHDGKKVDMLEKIEKISEGLPSLKKVVIVASQSNSHDKDISKIKNGCFLQEFLKAGEEYGNYDMKFEQVPFNHPVFISYTSGTTGIPKGILHGFGSFLTVARDFWITNKDYEHNVWFSVSPVGWISWNILTTLNGFGYTLVVYEGVPFYKSPTNLYDLFDTYGVTHCFTAPSILDEMEKRNCIPGENNSLHTLVEFLSGGSVVKPNNLEFMFKKVKKDIIFKACYGCTEVFGFCALGDPSIPVYKNELSSACLATEIFCYDDFGEPVYGELGELVLTKPSPSFPIGLWNDADGRKFKENYLSKFPGVFATGDYGIINPFTDGIIICGRCDETLKPRGCRFGSSEIYSIVNAFPEVFDSLCVSQFNKESEERAVLFIKVKENEILTDVFVQKIRDAIENELSARHVPEVILQTKDIPVNLNGKKMEIIVKKIINKMSYNPETVLNQDCLKNFQNIPELQDF